MKAGFFVKVAIVAGITAGSWFGHGVASADCCTQDNVQLSGDAGTAAIVRTTPLWGVRYTNGHAVDGTARPLPVLMVIANQD